MPLFYRDLHLRALEAAYHRHYDQLCAVAAAVLAADAYYEVTYTGELVETAYRIIQNMD